MGEFLEAYCWVWGGRSKRKSTGVFCSTISLVLTSYLKFPAGPGAELASRFILGIHIVCVIQIRAVLLARRKVRTCWILGLWHRKMLNEISGSPLKSPSFRKKLKGFMAVKLLQELEQFRILLSFGFSCLLGETHECIHLHILWSLTHSFKKSFCFWSHSIVSHSEVFDSLRPHEL